MALRWDGRKLIEVNSRKAEARRLGGVLTDGRIVRTCVRTSRAFEADQSTVGVACYYDNYYYCLYASQKE